jgi:hypothetical protein
MKYKVETEKRGIFYVIYSPSGTLMYQYIITVDNIYFCIIQEATQALRCGRIGPYLRLLCALNFGPQASSINYTQ